MRVEGIQSLLLIPYAPVGLIILLLRLAIFSHAYLASVLLTSCGAIKRFALQTMCSVLGWIISVEGRIPPGNEKVPMVSNHVSLFDHLIIYLTADCVTPHAHVFHWYSTYHKSDNDSITKLLECQGKAGWPVHLLPENLTPKEVNSVSAFNTHLFESLEKVQPIALKATRVFPIHLVEHPINWIAELLWQLFTPFTHYSVTYLEPISRLVDESAVEFAERVRKAIAHNLDTGTVPSVNHHTTREQTKRPVSYLASDRSSVSSSSSAYPTTSHDTTTRSSFTSDELDSDVTGARFRAALSKPSHPTANGEGRGESEQESNSASTSCLVDTSFDQLIPTIREILTQVPERKIRAALIKANGDIDTAIDYLVSTDTTEEQDCITPTRSVNVESIDTSLVVPSRLKTAAETFHTNSSARQASLAQRRQALLAHARKRFLVTSSNTDDISK